jgi:hypothetical protein
VGTALLTDLHARSTAEDRKKMSARLPAGYPVIGVRMKTLFDLAKAHSAMPLDDVSALLDRPEYEARLSDDDRRALCELYLARHERRTAVTAPLYWARYGTPAHLPDRFRLVEIPLGDDDVVVSKPVGIALKYAGPPAEPALRKEYS